MRAITNSTVLEINHNIRSKCAVAGENIYNNFDSAAALAAVASLDHKGVGNEYIGKKMNNQ